MTDKTVEFANNKDVHGSVVTFCVEAPLGAPTTILLNNFLSAGCRFLFHSQKVEPPKLQGMKANLFDVFYFSTTAENFETEFKIEYSPEHRFQFTKFA